MRQALNYKAEYETLRAKMQRELDEFRVEREQHKVTMAATQEREEKLAREVKHNVSLFAVMKLIVGLLIAIVLLFAVAIVVSFMLVSEVMAPVRAKLWEDLA